MRALITGGAGFLGTLLARRLLADPPALGGGPAGAVDELTLLDPLPPAADLAGDPRVRVVAAEIGRAHV